MMHLHVNHSIDLFSVLGVSFRKSDVQVRSKFSITEAATRQLLQAAKDANIQNLVVISTCNRTEIYAHDVSDTTLKQLFCRFATGADTQLLQKHAYYYTGAEALLHLYSVNAGLDSQIVGDFEIAGQIKHAVQLSRSYGLVGPVLDRAYNFAVQASKKIKNQTQLSSGTVSVSYAAIEWLQQQVGAAQKKVLVVGAGKFGAGVVKNLLHYMPQLKVSLTNRTWERAAEVKAAHAVEVLPFEQLQHRCKEYDVIITCTNAPTPLLYAQHFAANKHYFVVDLAVPHNVDVTVNNLHNVQMVRVDDLTHMLNNTIEMRMAEVPEARRIIAHHFQLFTEWMQGYMLVPIVQQARTRMLSLQQHLQGCNGGIMEAIDIGSSFATSEYHVDVVAQHLMANLKNYREKGCQYIAAYHRFFTADTQLA